MMFCHGQYNSFKKELLTVEMLFVWYGETLLFIICQNSKNHLMAQK